MRPVCSEADYLIQVEAGLEHGLPISAVIGCAVFQESVRKLGIIISLQGLRRYEIVMLLRFMRFTCFLDVSFMMFYGITYSHYYVTLVADNVSEMSDLICK